MQGTNVIYLNLVRVWYLVKSSIFCKPFPTPLRWTLGRLRHFDSKRLYARAIDNSWTTFSSTDRIAIESEDVGVSLNGGARVALAMREAK